mgnify:CR=1 FL=1|jgi:hypothetical protein
MLHKIKSWPASRLGGRLSILITIVSILSLLLIQNSVLAVWEPPIEGPPIGSSGSFLSSPLTIDLDIDSFDIKSDHNLRTNFSLSPNSETFGLQISGGVAGVFGQGPTGIRGQANIECTDGPTCYGIHGIDNTGEVGAFAGYFDGDVNINGSLDITKDTNSILRLHDATSGVGLDFTGNWPAIGFNRYYNAGNFAMGDGYTGVISMDNSGGDTAGNLQFYTGTFGNAGDEVSVYERMTIAQAGNVGIGTADPNSMLHVYYPVDGSTINAEIDIQTGGVDGSHWGIYHEDDDQTLRFWKDNNDGIIDNDDQFIFTDNGNLIATGSGNFLNGLGILGNSSFNGNVEVTTGNILYVNRIQDATDPGNDLYIGSAVEDVVVEGRLCLDSNAEADCRNAWPAASGDNWGSQVVQTLGSLTGNGGDGVGDELALAPIDCTVGKYVQAIASDGTVTCVDDDTGAGGDTDWVEGSGVVYNNTDNIGIGTGSPGYMLDVIKQAGQEGLFRVASSTATALSIKNSGNVSIGTTSNGAKLYVYGGNDNLFRVQSSQYANKGFFAGVDSNLTNMFRFRPIDGYSNLAFTNAGDTIGLYINASTTDRAAYVGIGTDDPSKRLTVKNGAVRIESAEYGVDSAVLQLANTTDNTEWNLLNRNNSNFIVQGFDGANYTFPFQIEHGAPTSLYIKDSGNVGIGTTGPLATLHVATSTVYSGGKAVIIQADIETNDSPYTQTLNLKGPGGWDEASLGLGANTLGVIKARYFGNNNDVHKGALDFYTRGASDGPALRMTINDLGNVGIGTNIPGSRLDIKSLSNNTDIFRILASDNQSIIEMSEGNVGGGFMDMMDTTGTLQVRLNTSGSSYFKGGSLGIGIVAPTEKLEVVGNIALTGSVDGYDLSNYGHYWVDYDGTPGQVIKWKADNSGVEWGDDNAGAGSDGYIGNPLNPSNNAWHTVGANIALNNKLLSNDGAANKGISIRDNGSIKVSSTQDGILELRQNDVNNSNYISLYDNTGNRDWYFGQDNNGKFTFNNKVLIDTSGNITLDGTIDGYDLDTYGPYWIDTGGTTNEQVLKWSATNSETYWGTDTNQYIGKSGPAHIAGAALAMGDHDITLNTGQIGIGVNPDYSLDVVGEIFTTTHLLADAWYGTTGNDDFSVGSDQNLWIGDGNDTVQIQGGLAVADNITTVLPTQNDHVATKEYVDAQVGGTSRPTWYLTWNNNINCANADTACDLGFHMCFGTEMYGSSWDSGYTIPRQSFVAWVDSPAYSCDGWTSSGGADSGSIMNMSLEDNGWIFSVSSGCSIGFRVACCSD